jgi:ABC-type Na+ transport system ATPase subunit NatA
VLVAQLRHLKGPGKIADDLLERFALTDASARKVSTYSGGMRQRLDIAMSLIGESDSGLANLMQPASDSPRNVWLELDSNIQCPG